MQAPHAIVSTGHDLEICLGADEAHEFFSKLEAKLLGYAGRPNPRDVPITIAIRARATGDKEATGTIEVNAEDKQLGRIDF